MRKGFTLLELLICAAILAILTVMAIPHIQKAINKMDAYKQEIESMRIELIEQQELEDEEFEGLFDDLEDLLKGVNEDGEGL